MGFNLEIVKVKGRVHWAIKVTLDGVSRYRGYYYKRDALTNLIEWQGYSEDEFRYREFNHNFNSAEELGIKEIHRSKSE